MMQTGVYVENLRARIYNNERCDSIFQFSSAMKNHESACDVKYLRMCLAVVMIIISVLWEQIIPRVGQYLLCFMQCFS